MNFRTPHIIATAILSLAITGMAHAATIDFSGWDPDILSTDGGTQTFNDNGLEVTVTSFGDFDAPTEFVDTIGGPVIASLHDGTSPPSDHGFEFCFNQSTDINLEFQLLDALEEYEISTTGTATYQHVFGTVPDVSTTASGSLLIDGAGFGQGPDGASNGIVNVTFAGSDGDPGGGDDLVHSPFCLSVTYRADEQFGAKFGSFRLNQVPEPATAGTLLAGLLGVMSMLRKKRR